MPIFCWRIYLRNEKHMKRNHLYAEMLKMELSWSIKTSNNPCGKDCKTKTGQPCSSSAMPLAEPHMLQLTHWLSCCQKRTRIMSISATKDEENYYQFLFYSNARPQGLLSQWRFSIWQISNCMLFVIKLGKTMSMGASLNSFITSRNIFYSFSFSVAWLKRPPFRWRWNPRAADTGTPVKDTL